MVYNLTGNHSGNILNGGLVCTQGSWLYFSNAGCDFNILTNRGFLMSAETGFITPTRIMMTIYSELIWKETVRPDSTLTVPGT